MSLSAHDITKLCEEWCLASKTPEGGMVIGASTEKYRLLANGIVFHELDYDALCCALTGTARVLLRPGLNTVVSMDHMILWSWCGELVLSPRADFFTNDQHEIKTLAETTVRASLVHCKKAAQNREEWEEQRKIDDLQNHHSKQFLIQSNVVLAYLTFPLLEAILKRACNQYIDFDGTVKHQFSVLNRQANQKTYDPNGRLNQCSSLRDLLFLHYNSIASGDLRAKLDEVRAHFTELDNNTDPYDLIYSWRNQSLHGSANFQTIGGVLLNLIFLISISECIIPPQVTT